MIDLTVKTLDSQNHTFSLEDDITVRGFKEYIAESVSVPADSQRLIYCGRVLQDEKKLNEYDVNGKVIHLVQRAPPQPGQRSNSGNQNQGQRTGLPMPAPNYYLSSGRLSVAKRMLDQANQVIDRLDDPNSPANPGPAASTASSLPRQEQMLQEADQEQQDNNDYGPIGGARLAQAASAAVVAAISAAGLNNVRLLRGRTEDGDEVAVLSNAFDDGIPRTQSQQQQPPSQPQQQSQQQQQQQQQEPPLQQRDAPSGVHEQTNERLPRLSVPRPPQMAELLDRLLSTQERLKPYIERYRVLMHADPSLSPGAGPEGVDENQRVVDGVSKSLHNISHACHALSDIIVDMGQEPPRNLSCRPILIEHSAILQAGIPIQVEADAVPEDTNQQENRPNQRERDPQQPQPQTAFGTVFNLPNNVEVLVEVSPESNMETPPSGEQTQNNRNNNNVNAGDTDSGAFPWGTPPTMDFIRNLMQIVAGHVVQGGAATTTMSMSNPASTAAGGQTTAAMADGTSPYPGQSTQARSNMGTHPTTSTQTRSTPRPHVFHPRVHPLEVGYEIARPRLGGFDPYLHCNSHHLHRTVSAATQTINSQQRSTVDQSTAPESGSPSQPTTTSSTTNSHAAASSPNAQPFNHFAIHLHQLLNETGGQPQSGASTAGAGIRHGWGSLIQILTGSGPRVGLLADGNNQSLADVTLADLLESELFMDIDSVDGQRRGENLFVNLTLVLMQNMTVEGLLRFRLGSWEPLANLRRPVREFLQHSFASATSPTEIQEQAVERLISELRPPLRQLLVADVESIGGTVTRVDIAATVEALLRRYIRDFLALLYDDAVDDTRFGQGIVTIMSELGANLCFVLRYYFHNGQAGLEAIAMRLMNELIERGDPVNQLMVSSFVSYFRTYSSRLSQPPVSEILPLLVHRDDANAPSSTPSVPVQQSQAEPEPMETEAVEVRTTTTDEALAAEDSDEDPGIFPGHEALPSDWVPIIARDGVRQRRQLQMQGMTDSSVTTFSDAYLGGMPSKRRKLIEQQKPCLLASPTPNHSSISISMERLIREGVGRAGVEEVEGAAATVATDAGVRHAFGQAIRDCLHPQRYGTPDFPDPLRFPNATKFFANHERN